MRKIGPIHENNWEIYVEIQNRIIGNLKRIISSALAATHIIQACCLRSLCSRGQ